MEKVSWAEDFFSHTLIRWCFRRWLKVCLLHNGETTPREPASAILSHHHSTYLHTCSLAFAGLCCPLSCTTIPFPQRPSFSSPHHSLQFRTLYTPHIHFTHSVPVSRWFSSNSCSCYPSQPLSQCCSVCVYWDGDLGRSCHSYLLLSSFLSTEITSPLWRRKQILSMQSVLRGSVSGHGLIWPWRKKAP